MGDRLPPLPADMPFPKPLVVLPNITIRPVHPSDAESMANHGNSAKIASNMSDRFPNPYTYMDAVHFINLVLSQPPTSLFALSLTPTSPCIGSVSVKWDADYPNVSHNVQIAYWLGEEYWGQGIVTAAVTALVDYLFKDVTEGGCQKVSLRIYIKCLARNGASAAVARKAGFTQEGRLRREFMKKGEYLDALVFSMLKEEWQEKQRQQQP